MSFKEKTILSPVYLSCAEKLNSRNTIQVQGQINSYDFVTKSFERLERRSTKCSLAI